MSQTQKVSFTSLLITLGIVFGDIGTSPLYVMTAILGKNIVTRELVLGGLSCVVWTLTIIGTIKYITLVLQADNKGEGGIFSLYTLVRRKSPKGMVYVAMIGLSALLADGMITPAISLTAAVEGLQHQYHSVPVVPIVIGIIFLLFTFQQYGTDRVGKTFGPIMIVWYGFLFVSGFMQLIKNPMVLEALNPWWALHILVTHPSALLILGAVFLCVTGVEALYSDLGHCGKTNIRYTWVFVKICLLVNYFGQGAFVLQQEGQVFSGLNPFFDMLPQQFVLFAVLIAILASIVASQALITGSFSLVNEALKLDCWFKIKVRRPSKHKQQIYIPFINWLLFLGTVGIVLHFQESRNMEAIYGLAISFDLLCTSWMLVYFFKIKSDANFLLRIALILLFVMIEFGFLYANLGKFWQGGYIVISISLLLFLVTYITYEAKQIQRQRRQYIDIHDHSDIIQEVSQDKEIPKFATNLVYLTNARKHTKLEQSIIESIYSKHPKRADYYWLVHFNETDEPFTEYWEFHELYHDKIYRLDFYLGYKVRPFVNKMFWKAYKKLSASGKISTENKYPSLKKFHIEPDFLFVILNSTFNTTQPLGIHKELVIKGYKLLKHISEPADEHYGLDKNRLLVEEVAIV